MTRIEEIAAIKADVKELEKKRKECIKNTKLYEVMKQYGAKPSRTQVEKNMETLMSINAEIKQKHTRMNELQRAVAETRRFNAKYTNDIRCATRRRKTISDKEAALRMCDEHNWTPVEE